MLPKNENELQKITDECKNIATTRAAIAAGAAIVPIPGVDIAADIGLLVQAMPVIIEKFGLSKDQVESYSPELKILVYNLAKKLGIEVIGVLITEEIVRKLLLKVAGRVAVKSMSKYIPFVGPAIAASVGFAAMKLILDDLVNDCHKVCVELLLQNSLNSKE